MSFDNFDPTKMNIIQDVDFDPMAILKGDAKIDNKTAIIDTSGKDDKPDPNDPPAPAPTGKANTIELDDAMIQQGLKRAGGDSTFVSPDGSGDDKGGKGITKEDKDNAYAVHYNLMVEAGEWEALEGFDGSEEKYLEARQTNNEKGAINLTTAWFDDAFKNNPDGAVLGTKLFNHLKNGGKVSDFVNVMAPLEFDLKAIESDDDTVAEEAAKELIKRYYTSIGWKGDRVTSRLQNLSRTGMLVDEAKQVKEPYEDLLEIQQSNENTRLANDAANRKQSSEKINKELLNLIDSNHSFGALKSWKDRKDRTGLEEYLFQADAETKKTSFSEDLNNGLKDPKFLLFVANALRNNWHTDSSALSGAGGDDGKAASQAAKSLQSTLEGALLNKKLDSKDSGVGQNHLKQSSKFEFNLDNAVVIS